MKNKPFQITLKDEEYLKFGRYLKEENGFIVFKNCYSYYGFEGEIYIPKDRIIEMYKMKEKDFEGEDLLEEEKYIEKRNKEND